MTDYTDVLLHVLEGYVGGLVARSILRGASRAAGVDTSSVTFAEVATLERALAASVGIFIDDERQARECISRLSHELYSHRGPSAPPPDAERKPVRIGVTQEYDIVRVRSHAKGLCDELGFAASEQIKVATVVSELARNILQYVGDGAIELEAIDVPRRGVEVRAIDQGAGIPNIETILAGGYRSKTGMGIGLIGTRKVMDEFEIETAPGVGTKVTTRKYVA